MKIVVGDGKKERNVGRSGRGGVRESTQILDTPTKILNTTTTPQHHNTTTPTKTKTHTTLTTHTAHKHKLAKNGLAKIGLAKVGHDQFNTAETTTCLMPSQRTSSQTASRDCCCCGCYTKISLLGRNQGKCLLQLNGTRYAGRAWYEHSKALLDLRLSLTRMSMTSHLRSRRPPTSAKMHCSISWTSSI